MERRERYTYYVPTCPSPFPFSKEAGGKSNQQNDFCFLPVRGLFFFTKKFPFISLRVPIFFFFLISKNFTERLTGKEYRSMVLRPNSPKCSKRYLDRWNLPIAGRSSTYAYLRLTKCLVIVSVVVFYGVEWAILYLLAVVSTRRGPEAVRSTCGIEDWMISRKVQNRWESNLQVSCKLATATATGSLSRRDLSFIL